MQSILPEDEIFGRRMILGSKPGRPRPSIENRVDPVRLVFAVIPRRQGVLRSLRFRLNYDLMLSHFDSRFRPRWARFPAYVELVAVDDNIAEERIVIPAEPITDKNVFADGDVLRAITRTIIDQLDLGTIDASSRMGKEIVVDLNRTHSHGAEPQILVSFIDQVVANIDPAAIAVELDRIVRTERQPIPFHRRWHTVLIGAGRNLQGITRVSDETVSHL